MRVCGEAFPFIRRELNLTFFARHADVEHILGDRRFGRDTRHAPCGAARVAPQVYERIYPPQYLRFPPNRGELVRLFRGFFRS